MDMEQGKSFIHSRSELLYLAGLAVFFAYRTFFNTTMRRATGFQRIRTAEHVWLLFMLTLILLKMFYIRCYSAWEIAAGLMLIVLCAVVWKYSHTFWMLMFPLVVVGAKGVSFDRILKVYLTVNGIILGTAVVLSLCGVIRNYRYERWVQDLSYAGGGYTVIRNSFGTTFPTTFSEFVFFWSGAWLCVRRKTVKYYDVLLLTVFSLVLYRFCDAVTDSICEGLLAIAAFWILLKKRLPERFVLFLKKAGAVLVLPMPLFSIGMCLLAGFYDAEDALWRLLDQELHLRLSYGNIGIRNYGIRPFGSWVKYQMNTLKENYFNIDCSYLMVLVNFGLLFFIVLIAFFTRESWLAWQEGNSALLLVLAVIALECIMENRLMQPQYNVFCLLFFAERGPEGPDPDKPGSEDRSISDQSLANQSLTDRNEEEKTDGLSQGI